MTDLILFVVFPYVAITLAVVVTLWRFLTNPYGFSSLSSQLLEKRQLFWGSPPWHLGILTILIGHLIGVVLPGGVRAFNGVPLRLYILEGTALAFGLLSLFGIFVLIYRRAANGRVRRLTSIMDAVLLTVLFAQVVSGVYTAVFYRWGSFWYLDSAAPYLRSLLTLTPKPEYIANLPLIVKAHAFNAFLLIALFPFTRLVHMLFLPFTYLWRPYQVVRWNWHWSRTEERRPRA